MRDAAPLVADGLDPQVLARAVEMEQELQRLAYQARIDNFSHGSEFMRFFLTHYQGRMVWQDGPLKGSFIPPAPVHYRIASEFDQGLSTLRIGGWRSLIEVFRGAAKTTLGAEAGSLFLITKGRKNVLLICANRDEAKARIQAITHELTTNPSLLEEYPDLAPAKDDKGQWVSYTDYQIVFSNGARIKAYGYGAKLRGSLWNGFRPDGVIVDDGENDDMQRSDLEMFKAWYWLEHVLLPALSKYAALFWIGTPLSPRCILYRLREEKNWQGPRQPVRNDDGSPHWPEHCPEEWIAFMEEELGPHAAQQELHLVPLPTNLQAFRAEWLDQNQYNPALLVNDNGRVSYDGRPLRVYGWYDAASSLEEQADRTAVVIVGIDQYEDVYVLEAWAARAQSPEVAARLAELNRRWKPQLIGMQKKIGEIMMRQQVLASHAVPIVGISQPRDQAGKEFRIRGLAVHVANGKVKFDFRDPMQREELRREMLDYPMGHDDLPDALEGAVNLAQGGGNTEPGDNSGAPRRESYKGAMGRW